MREEDVPQESNATDTQWLFELKADWKFKARYIVFAGDRNQA